MDIEALIEAAKATVIDADELKAIKERMKEAEKRFAEESRAKAVNHEFLTRTYSL
jgi:hypothetical protein